VAKDWQPTETGTPQGAVISSLTHMRVSWSGMQGQPCLSPSIADSASALLLLPGFTQNHEVIRVATFSTLGHQTGPVGSVDVPVTD